MRSYDPFQFGRPPADAVADPDALSEMMGAPASPNFQQNMPFLGDNTDIPRSDDANPFKTPDGQQKFSDPGYQPGGVAGPGAPGMAPGAPDDPEALQAAVLQAAMRENENSEAFQEGEAAHNEDEALDRMKFEEGM